MENNENLKVVYCEYTGAEVLSRYFPEDVELLGDEWTHLHNETVEEDIEDVRIYRENLTKQEIKP